MWDPNSQSLCIKDINDLYECLSCGIILEQKHGELISILDKTKLYYDKETSIKGIIKKLKKLKNRIDEIVDDDNEKREIQRVEYFDISNSEIDTMISALRELNAITKYFYDDFSDQGNDFKLFYKKLEMYLFRKY